HEVANNLVAAPFLQRFLRAERVAEIDGSGEVLLGAVEPVEGAKLLCAKHAERFEYLGADFVLTAVTTSRGRERRAVSLAAVQHHQQPIVFVVGMCGGLQEDAGIGEMTKREAKRDVALR